MAKRGDPEVLRLVAIFLRSRARMSQTEFGRACNLTQAKVSSYESGEVAAPEDVLRRMAKVAGLTEAIVGHLRQFIALALTPSPQVGAVGPPESVSCGEVIGAELAPYVLELQHAKPSQPSPEDSRREAEWIWTALERFPIQRRAKLIKMTVDAGGSWALAERFVHESERMAAHHIGDTLELAALGLEIASRVPGEEGWRSRVMGYCWAFVANARRVANDFAGADEAFAKAWELWRAGRSSGPQWLAEWRLLDLEASLRRAQRRFTEALELLDQARSACRSDPLSTALILLKKESVFEQEGEIGKALETLREAAPLVEAAGDPLLLFALRFNMAADLCHLERYSEAEALLPQVRQLATKQANELNLIRVDWLGARADAGLGRFEEAMAGLETVREAFTQRRLPYDAALVSLDLAVLWLKAGRTAQVKELTGALRWVFQEKGIEREALASLKLFCDAARQESATVELTRRVISEVEKARRSAPARE